MATANTSIAVSVPGEQYSLTEAVVYDQKTTTNPTLEAPKTGTLTTRTDNNTGTLTMDAGHGITTGAKIDIYWTNANGTVGIQYDVTAGTVSGNSVPIDLGAGDNLPAAATAVRVQVQNVEEMLVVGNNVRAILMNAPTGPAHVKVCEGDGTLIARLVARQAGAAYVWVSTLGSTNPAAGVSIEQVVMTNGVSAAAQSPVATVLSV